MNLKLIENVKDDPIAINTFGLNYNLIKQILIADALGLSENPPPFYMPSIGSSIHLDSHKISSVEAFMYS